MSSQAPILSVSCLVYNHEPFLRQCLDGFVMQRTRFPFEVIVHDDASTDGSAAIIREYAEQYPHLIKPIFETENQYSKHDGSIRRIMLKSMAPTSRYVANCEGDDYWIDPHKIERQLSFLEENPQCTLVCGRARQFSMAANDFVEDVRCYNRDRDMEPRDIIMRGGLFIPTCTIVYRRELKQNGYPDYCKKNQAGDYAIQLLAAMKGTCHYFDTTMGVYRIANNNSWVGRQGTIPIEKYIAGRQSEVNMLHGFEHDYPLYGDVFRRRIAFYINGQVPLGRDKADIDAYLNHFSDEIKQYKPFWKLHLNTMFSTSFHWLHSLLWRYIHLRYFN